MSAALRCRSAPRSPHANLTAVRVASKPGSLARKTPEKFDFTFQRSVKKTVVEHLGQLDFLHAKENVILLGPPDLVSHCPLRVCHCANSPASD
jgi:DNA replication protein DnaC